MSHVFRAIDGWGGEGGKAKVTKVKANARSKVKSTKANTTIAKAQEHSHASKISQSYAKAQDAYCIMQKNAKQ